MVGEVGGEAAGPEHPDYRADIGQYHRRRVRSLDGPRRPGVALERSLGREDPLPDRALPAGVADGRVDLADRLQLAGDPGCGRACSSRPGGDRGALGDAGLEVKSGAAVRPFRCCRAGAPLRVKVVNAERCCRCNNIAATIIGDVVGVSRLSPGTRDRFAAHTGATQSRSPRRLHDLPAVAAREPARQPRHPDGRDHPDPPPTQRKPGGLPPVGPELNNTQSHTHELCARVPAGRRARTRPI